jgi:hypothetical protein
MDGGTGRRRGVLLKNSSKLFNKGIINKGGIMKVKVKVSELFATSLQAQLLKFGRDSKWNESIELEAEPVDSDSKWENKLEDRNMKDERCKYCGGPVAIRNPTGVCDHLYYPENCNTKLCRWQPVLSEEQLAEFDRLKKLEAEPVSSEKNFIRKEIIEKIFLELDIEFNEAGSEWSNVRPTLESKWLKGKK